MPQLHTTKTDSMDLQAALQRCLGPDDHAYTLPPEVYTDPAILDQERAMLFRDGWLCLGRADQVAKIGDYVCHDVANQSIILLRDSDGHCRAFANSCRHRGARLLDGAGNARGIRCPFHSWAYKLDGTLAGAPHMEEAVGFCRSDYGLISYKASERLGFVFVHLAAEPCDLDLALGDFAAIHAPWPMETLISKRKRSFEVDCNWKIFLEVFNEYYHLPFVHPDTVDGVYNTPDARDHVAGEFATQFGQTEGTGGLLQTNQQKPLPAMPNLPAREMAGVRYTWSFPNMTFAIGLDAMWVYEAYPIAVDKCFVTQTACFPPETVAQADFDELVEAYYHRLDAALAEDIPALVNQQRGLSCPETRQGRLQPLREANVASFARWYAGKMGGVTA
jgi:phenylpropionate dioxygenase-like ring-hydroxylating dioxygenase large terminal subunit